MYQKKYLLIQLLNKRESIKRKLANPYSRQKIIKGNISTHLTPTNNKNSNERYRQYNSPADYGSGGEINSPRQSIIIFKDKANKRTNCRTNLIVRGNSLISSKIEKYEKEELKIPLHSKRISDLNQINGSNKSIKFDQLNINNIIQQKLRSIIKIKKRNLHNIKLQTSQKPLLQNHDQILKIESYQNTIDLNNFSSLTDKEYGKVKGIFSVYLNNMNQQKYLNDSQNKYQRNKNRSLKINLPMIQPLEKELRMKSVVLSDNIMEYNIHHFFTTNLFKSHFPNAYSPTKNLNQRNKSTNIEHRMNFTNSDKELKKKR